MSASHRLPVALTIAGSDNSGGAGIQADLKAFSANGAYGQSAIVALVDENTQGVFDLLKIPPQFVAQQINTCLGDIGADAIKIGMLGDAELVEKVGQTLENFQPRLPCFDRIVLDPVMVSTSGHQLLENSAIEVLKQKILPIARVITPNLPEAELLLNRKIVSASEFDAAARELSELGSVNRRSAYKLSVLLKAGHLNSDEDVLVDYFYDADQNKMIQLPHPRLKTKNTHGTGCTLSSAFAAWLAKGADLETAAVESTEYVAKAVLAAKDLQIGEGHGPVHHFYAWW